MLESEYFFPTPLWPGLPTRPRVLTEGLRLLAARSKRRPSVGAGGTVRRPCHNRTSSPRPEGGERRSSASEEPAVQRCPTCGKMWEPAVRYCPEDGTPLGDATPPVLVADQPGPATKPPGT